MAQFAINSRPSTTTKHSPFEVLMGFIPKGHQVFRQSRAGRMMSHLDCISQLCQEVELNIKHVQELVIKQSKFKPFLEGQKVWLDSTHLKTTHPVTKLCPKRYGPFTVTKKISHVAYQVDLPPSWKIHNAFHASLLSPYRETPEHGQNFMEPPPDLIDGEQEWEVECIVATRLYRCNKKHQYRIRWKGYSEAHDTWEPVSNVHAPDLMAAFHQKEQQTPMIIRTIKVGQGSIQESMSSPSPNESSASSSPCSSSGSFVSCPYCVSQSVVDALANALNELTLNPLPEPDNWREEELDRLSRLATFIAHIDKPFLTSERLEFPVIDWEIPSSLRHLPHSSYSLRSPRALQDLHVGIIPPTSIRGLHFGFGTETVFEPPFTKVFRGPIERAILRKDFWNRAVLNVPDSAFMSSPTRPSSSSIRHASAQRSPSPSNHLLTLTTQEVKDLPDFVDQTHVPRSFPEQETRSVNDNLHPGCPWVKAN